MTPIAPCAPVTESWTDCTPAAVGASLAGEEEGGCEQGQGGERREGGKGGRGGK